MNATVTDTASTTVATIRAAKRACAGLKPRQPVEAALVPGALLTWTTIQLLTGLSQRTLRRLLAEDPKFPPLLHVGGAARFRASQVNAWLAAQTAKAAE
jgi:predicted DNA-binding transcriptional regulator AlpA